MDLPIELSQTQGGALKTQTVRRLRRVLYLTDLRPADKFGSLEEQIFILAQSLRQAGGLLLPVFGAPVGAQTAEQYRLAGSPVDWLDLHEFSFATLRRLLSLVRTHRIELVHWNFYSSINPYVWALSILAPHLGHYLTDHNSRIPGEKTVSGPAKRSLKKVLRKRYSRVLGISDFVVYSLKSEGTWSNLSRCTYFINTERFSPDPAVRKQCRNLLGVDQKFVMLFVGNQIKWKGGDVAIRALAELPESVVLCILGDGVALPMLRELTDCLHLNDRVQFLGNQRHVEPFMKAADCFLCPSLWEEATGLVNLEALGCGVPVVASAIGGIPEFIEDGKTGLLFPPGDHLQLAARLRYLLNNPEVRKQMSQSARAAALERFSIERRLPEYVELYSDN